MKKPVILINGGPAFDKMFESDSWGINKTYVHAVGAAGGAPVLCADDFSAEEYAQVCDGLILTGSFSYCPRMELRDRLSQVGQRERVVFDRKLFEAFKAAGKPIFGICLGEQIINLFLGGMHQRYQEAPGPCKLESVRFTIDTGTGRCTAAELVDIAD